MKNLKIKKQLHENHFITPRLICPNGHTIQNAVEVVGDDNVIQLTRVKKIKTVKKEILDYDTVDPSVGSLIIIREFFHEAMAHFNFKSDFAYKNFCELLNLHVKKSSELAQRFLNKKEEKKINFSQPQSTEPESKNIFFNTQPSFNSLNNPVLFCSIQYSSITGTK